MKVDIDCTTIPEFSRDFEKLCKKYPHLKEDFERALKVICVEPENQNRSPRIDNLGEHVKTPIHKLKKFRSIDFKHKGARSGFRLIYAYKNEENRIILIEIYHKNQQENEDRDRILRYFGEK